ncbi:unnamed protein product [Leptidea sinapis]|uniref:Uncharacterized protein n=1 Tax=Leptidea sinapis TaxID=189913 RepID=A0A5E4PW33_9NEOP|nr:unnamed protein product [Leptidea sinapis]
MNVGLLCNIYCHTMSTLRQIVMFLCIVVVASALPRPDCAGHPLPPGPGISYGGIPYGSVSGDVAASLNRQASIPGLSYLHTNDHRLHNIEQYL